jgi:hypothetical protein
LEFDSDSCDAHRVNKVFEEKVGLPTVFLLYGAVPSGTGATSSLTILRDYNEVK